ncbi:MAG: ribosome maturation factor RimP [Zoogloeaceae bacterium]|jgi:ribosome maturation factor RimP|nr:ribosome maturation factor RimP [Zoogloeaceae bacterium]
MDLLKAVEQAVEGLGYELVDFETSPQARLLRVFIDTPDGVGIEDCTRVSNHLTRLFAVENIDYDRLEVSSPGLDRPLKKEADFVRFAGQEAQLRLSLAVNGQRNFTGVLAGVADGRLRLECDGKTHEFELQQVAKARLVPQIKF